MTIKPGDQVKIRVPNWRKVSGEWQSSPSEHVVTATAAFPEYIEFEGKPWSAGMMISRRQIVTEGESNE